MSLPLRPEHAPREICSAYEEFHRRLALPAPPNLILRQGHSVAATLGTCGLVQHVLVGGEIPRWAKEMIFVAISRERNCRYCEAVHLACCRMLGGMPG